MTLTTIVFIIISVAWVVATIYFWFRIPKEERREYDFITRVFVFIFLVGEIMRQRMDANDEAKGYDPKHKIE